jgi:hypothetical protein
VHDQLKVVYKLSTGYSKSDPGGYSQDVYKLTYKMRTLQPANFPRKHFHRLTRTFHSYRHNFVTSPNLPAFDKHAAPILLAFSLHLDDLVKLATKLQSHSLLLMTRHLD